MRIVDEFATALSHLTREIDRTRKPSTKRKTTAAGPIARLVDCRERPAPPKLVPAGKPRKARADDRHIAAPMPRRRKRAAEWASDRAGRSKGRQFGCSSQKLPPARAALHRCRLERCSAFKSLVRRQVVPVAEVGHADDPRQAPKRFRSSHCVFPPRLFSRLSPLKSFGMYGGPRPWEFSRSPSTERSSMM